MQSRGDSHGGANFLGPIVHYGVPGTATADHNG